nr:MAG: DNA pilot protein [Microvirus sp.]
MGFLSMGGSLNQMSSGKAISSVNPALVAGIGLGVIDIANQFYWSKKNYDLQERTYDYNKALQSLIFAREDNSVQRRVADLKAAGLSPVLAAGSGAGTGAAISLNTPQMSAPTLSDKAQMAIAMMKMEADISKTYAENQLIELQKQKVPYEIASTLSLISKTLEDTKKSKAETYRTYKEAGLTIEKTRQEKVSADTTEASGVPGQGPVGKTVNDIMGALKKAMEFDPFGNGAAYKTMREPQINKSINAPKKRR